MMNQVGMELRRSPIGWRMVWLFLNFGTGAREVVSLKKSLGTNYKQVLCTWAETWCYGFLVLVVRLVPKKVLCAGDGGIQ